MTILRDRKSSILLSRSECEKVLQKWKCNPEENINKKSSFCFTSDNLLYLDGELITADVLHPDAQLAGLRLEADGRGAVAAVRLDVVDGGLAHAQAGAAAAVGELKGKS